MGYDRIASKWLARRAMRNVTPHPMLVTLVYLLLTGIVGSLVINLAADPFEAAYYYLTETSYDTWEILTAIFTPQRIAVLAAMEGLVTLYSWVVSYGYTAYCLRLTRQESAGYRTLLEGFYQMGRALAGNLLNVLFLVLCGLPAAAVCGVLALLSGLVGSAVLAMTGAMAAAFWLVAVSYRFRLSIYFLLDNPEMRPLEAVRRSWTTMKGRAGELFVQDLSFLGWVLLIPFTLGIVNLWLCPYLGTAGANFYAWAVYGSLPGQPRPGQEPGGIWP